MGAMASPITGVSIVYSTVCSGVDQRNYLSSTALAFVMGIRRWPVNTPHRGPVTRKMFLFHDVIIKLEVWTISHYLSSNHAPFYSMGSTNIHEGYFHKKFSSYES